MRHGASVINAEKLYPSDILGKVIKNQRKLLNLTQYDIANSCGITRSYISLIESGKRSIDINLLEKISVSLKMSMTQIVFLIEEEMNS